MKAQRWFIKFPMDAYAMGPVDFGKPVDERHVRAYARRFEGVKRLPIGFHCWGERYYNAKLV